MVKMAWDLLLTEFMAVEPVVRSMAPLFSAVSMSSLFFTSRIFRPTGCKYIVLRELYLTSLDTYTYTSLYIYIAIYISLYIYIRVGGFLGFFVKTIIPGLLGFFKNIIFQRNIIFFSLIYYWIKRYKNLKKI